MKSMMSMLVAVSMVVECGAGVLGDLIDIVDGGGPAKTMKPCNMQDYSTSYPSNWKIEKIQGDIVQFFPEYANLTVMDARVTIKKLYSTATIDTFVKAYKNETAKTRVDVKLVREEEHVYSSATGDAASGRALTISFIDGRDQYILYSIIYKSVDGFQVLSYYANKNYFSEHSVSAKRIIDNVIFKEGFLVDEPPVGYRAQKQNLNNPATSRPDRKQVKVGGSGTRSPDSF